MYSLPAQLIAAGSNLFKIMIKFKQFIVESNFNMLPSYIVDQIRKLVADYIDRGCKNIRYKPVTHLSLLGYVNIEHLNTPQYKIPIMFTKFLDSGGEMITVYNTVKNNLVTSLQIHISLEEYRNITNKKHEILKLYSLLIHETSHVIDDILKRFKNKSTESYDKISVRMDQLHAGAPAKNNTERKSLYKDYITHPVELSSISSEIMYTIMEYYSKIKTKPAKQLFLKQLEIFVKFNFDAFLDEDSEFKLPPFLRSEYLRGFFKRLEPGSKLYKKTKLSLLNLYYDLLAGYH